MVEQEWANLFCLYIMPLSSLRYIAMGFTSLDLLPATAEISQASKNWLLFFHVVGYSGIPAQMDRKTHRPKIWMYRDKASGRSKGECTVTFEDPFTAKSAIEWFDGKDFMGKGVKVCTSRTIPSYA